MKISRRNQHMNHGVLLPWSPHGAYELPTVKHCENNAIKKCFLAQATVTLMTR